MRWKHRDNRSAKLPLKTELILMSSGGGVGPYRSDMQDRHADVSQARPTSELLVMLCLSSVWRHHRLQRASQCAKWRVPSINDEFAEGLSVVKVNLHQISNQHPLCNQTSLRVRCHLLPFRHCFWFCLIDRRDLCHVMRGSSPDIEHRDFLLCRTHENRVRATDMRCGLGILPRRLQPTGQCFHSAPSGISGGAFRSLGSSQDTRHCGRSRAHKGILVLLLAMEPITSR